MHGHEAVFLKEAIEGLHIKPDGIYVDGTFGRGGHAEAILKALSPKGKLLAFDKDKDAVAFAEAHFSQDPRFQIFHQSFANLNNCVQNQPIDGILLDLGVSSVQLDSAERGFSFLQAGPLDMRMNQDNPMTASIFINQAKEEELAYVFKTYGEERFAKRIAKAIVQARLENPIETTEVLASIVKAANPQWEKHKHPATRVFQAIRVYINQELDDLKIGLEQAFQALAPHGRMVVISFHSLEDRIVKEFMRFKEKGAPIPAHYPLPVMPEKPVFVRCSKALKPMEAEIRSNRRARSAILRIGEKLS